MIKPLKKIVVASFAQPQLSSAQLVMDGWMDGHGFVSALFTNPFLMLVVLAHGAEGGKIVVVACSV